MRQSFPTGKFEKGLHCKSKENIEKLIIEVKNLTHNIWKLQGDELVQTQNKLNRLFCNLKKITNEDVNAMAYIKKELSSGFDFNLLIDLQTGISLGGTIYFLRHFDPQLRNLSLIFRTFLDNIKNENFLKILFWVMNSWSRKVGRISISNISQIVWRRHIHAFHKLHMNVEERLFLHFKDDVEDIEVIKQNLQHQLDLHPHSRMFVHIQHRRRAHLLRHKSYTSMTSSPILMSHLGGTCRTINLKSCQGGEVGKEIVQEIKTNQFKFDFLISQPDEIEMLGKLITSTPDININSIQIFLSSDSSKNSIKKFCESFIKINKNVGGLVLFNATYDLIGFDEIENLMKNTQNYLRIDYLHEVCENDKSELERKLASIWKLKPPTLNIDMRFQTQQSSVHSSITSEVPSTTYNVQQVARSTFDEEAFTKYLKSLELFYGGMDGNRILATPKMLRNIPSLVEPSFDGRMRTMGAKRYTDLFDLFPNGIPMKNVIGLVGDPGSGKTVLLKLMQLMFINSGYFPFPIQFKEVDGKREWENFAHFVSTAYPGFPIEDLKGFGEWLTKNSHRIVFLCDGLDETSIDMRANVRGVNMHDCASAQTWLASLFSRKIMPDSMVVFTSRPASIFKLSMSQRPDVMYSLDGLDSASMESVVNIYNKKNCSQIITLINTIASKGNNFLHSPFAVSLIATSYNMSSNDKIHADITLTSLYVNALEQRRRSVYNRRPCNESALENKHVQDLVDQFYLNRYMANRLGAFSVAELKEFGLSTEQLENHSFVNVYKQNVHFIPDEDTMIEPSHLSVMEFHCAKALINKTNVEDFKNAVNELFVLDDQDRKTLIRRFICGLIAGPDSDEEKQKVFLEKLVNVVKNSTSGHFALNYKRDMYFQAEKLKGNLLNDIAELEEDMLQLLKKKFSSDTTHHMEFDVRDVSLLNGVAKFINKIDPQLFSLSMYLNDKLHSDDVCELINAIHSLTRNVVQMQLAHIRHCDIDVMKKLVGKVETSLLLNYDDEVDASKIDELKTALQCELDITQSKKMFVELEHRYNRELIRHCAYTSTSSPLILPSHFGGNEKTMNLSKQLPANYEDAINGKSFDFVISQTHEIENLSRVMAANSNLVIRILHIYHSAQIDMNLVKMFCGNLHKLKNKIGYFCIYNVDEAVFNFDQIRRLMEQVERNLELYFINTISVNANYELRKLIQSVHKSTTLRIRLQFRNDCNVFYPHPSSSTSQHKSSHKQAQDSGEISPDWSIWQWLKYHEIDAIWEKVRQWRNF